jgi:hypothetical protein
MEDPLVVRARRPGSGAVEGGGPALLEGLRRHRHDPQRPPLAQPRELHRDARERTRLPPVQAERDGRRDEGGGGGDEEEPAHSIPLSAYSTQVVTLPPSGFPDA